MSESIHYRGLLTLKRSPSHRTWRLEGEKRKRREKKERKEREDR
jgi:hypothetical protein